ncbi:unnamed protein product [Paramecium pentaurelia]|uniref:Uncharacterized protein n=1 Tax=Paramecium pentaurelia TaxID=43138 RepID=A0A8S1VLU7_9CILI|nr:unnamed protein product [Paramecium pentaurelia]
MDNNIWQLSPLLFTKNESKTSSLNRICPNHKKEIILIDMDSQNKKIEDRFACVDCIPENPQIKYCSIETINKQRRDYNSGSYKMLSEYQKKSKYKKTNQFKLIASIRKNCNKKFNEISEKFILEQFQSFDKSKDTKQIKNVTIQALKDEQLLKDLKQLINQLIKKNNLKLIIN